LLQNSPLHPDLTKVFIAKASVMLASCFKSKFFYVFLSVSVVTNIAERYKYEQTPSINMDEDYV
ncbi:hypothetical protein P3553_22955, partial [Vibrio parahaemolyticus]|nr:hypothetical protein [Vibrio parahaemolyticus]MDF4796928.1 hypothetical protein [Vibrio parahaemolyticus]MDG2687255.1 hypothetical protein [Vibrio parahaemolyticus]